MESAQLSAKASQYLLRLCHDHPHRRVGSPGNRAATEFFAETVAGLGFQPVRQEFDCIDWKQNGATLTAGGKALDVLVSPYSLGCQVTAPLVVASSIEELEAVEADGRLLLARGELAHEQLMPKNFPFFNPDHHRRIVSLLEAKNPLAIVAATGRNPGLAGALYPFPFIVDGDFDIPSVYMKDVDGDRLATFVGQEIKLTSIAERIPARGWNVVARTGVDFDRRLLVMAHIDSHGNAPGAVDNAAGVVVLLLLAELLTGHRGHRGIEIVAVNGEDDYSAAGEKAYIREIKGRFSEIALAVNVDGVGYREGQTAYSFYECPDEMAAIARQVFGEYPELMLGEPWPQSDHMIFAMNGRPALAVTTERFQEMEATIAHTPADHPGQVDVDKLVTTAQALRDLALALDRRPA